MITRLCEILSKACRQSPSYRASIYGFISRLHEPSVDVFGMIQVITTPFHPGYITKERIAKAPKLKLALTAGIGSDHVDLPAASEAGITVAEITGSPPNHCHFMHIQTDMVVGFSSGRHGHDIPMQQLALPLHLSDL